MHGHRCFFKILTPISCFRLCALYAIFLWETVIFLDFSLKFSLLNSAPPFIQTTDVIRRSPSHFPNTTALRWEGINLQWKYFILPLHLLPTNALQGPSSTSESILQHKYRLLPSLEVCWFELTAASLIRSYNQMANIPLLLPISLDPRFFICKRSVKFSVLSITVRDRPLTVPMKLPL